ncbi:MAG: hypothetical protein BWX82_00452 [Parcubacteria group bacterium ADurb.Bin115]|nr:MAG: hypothetical protein BWX82_00452 [Parcubacteria group bacterium ADurb.Bin115]
MKKYFISHDLCKLLAKEIFYFFSALVAVGLAFESLLPGFFCLYFNVSVLAGFWLLSLIISLLCIKEKK